MTKGPMVASDLTRKFIAPPLQKIVELSHSYGKPCFKHTDGNIWGIMDMLLSTGVDMLGPLEPAYMALDEVRRYSAGTVGVMGNVDVDLLGRGSVEDVRAVTRELLRHVSPLGGHLLGSGNSISSAVRPENFLAMLETVREYGTYPINVS